MVSLAFQRQLAKEAYSSARDAVTNNIVAEGKIERLEYAIKQMQNAKDIYARLGDQEMVTKCEGMIYEWQGEKQWFSANKIPTVERIKVREQAVESLEKAIHCFEDSHDIFQTKLSLRRKFYYQGVIESHRLNLKQARQHFEDALKIAEENDKDSVDFFRAAIIGCDAWDLVVRRFKELEHIPYEDIIKKFQEAADLYRLTKDIVSINYTEGWRDFFQYILEPTKDELFESFKSKVLAIEVEVDGKIPRVWLKTGVLNNLSDHVAIFQKQLRSFLLERQFNIFAEELNAWLRDVLYFQKPRLSSKPESLEGCYIFVRDYLKIKPDMNIEWLVWDWRKISKHKYQSKEDAERVSKLAIENAHMIEILPLKIKEFKNVVGKASQEIRRKAHKFPLDHDRSG